MQVRDFLLRLALCRGISITAKHRLWECASRLRTFTDLKLLIRESQISLRAQTALQTNWKSKELTTMVKQNQVYPYLTLVDSAYPPLLRETFCPPLVLFYRGDISLLRYSMIGIVGARNMTRYGECVLRGLIPPLVKKRVVIVSGLARGIDGLSHRVTLQHGGMTIGVVGCGLDRYYPPEHYSLQQAMERQGLVLSEYGYGQPPLAYHFPERNRIIAGLTQTLLVVEAKRRSGSLITANLALDENRTVCAVPGRIDAVASMGCNELIAAGAKPILNAQGLLEEF